MQKLTYLFLVALVTAKAQVGTFPTGGIWMMGVNTQQSAVPAGNSPTVVSVVVDAAATGGDLIDVAVGDPSVVISLITPSGTEINAANAGAFGLRFLQAHLPVPFRIFRTR